MKKVIKIGLYLLGILFLISCQKSEKVKKITFEDILPSYYKLEKVAGYQIDKNTKYIRKNIFSLKSRKQNIYGFNVSNYKIKGELLLDQFPHNFCIGKDGSIYIHNWDNQEKTGKLIDPEIIKIGQKGNFLIKKRMKFTPRIIHEFVRGYLFLGGHDYYAVLNITNLENVQSLNWIDHSEDTSMSTDNFIILNNSPDQIIYGSGKSVSVINLTNGMLSTNQLYHQYDGIYAKYDFSYVVRYESIFEVKTQFGGFQLYTVGFDQFANKYFANAYYNKKQKKIKSLSMQDGDKGDIPVDYILVQSKRNKRMWKLKFPYLYGKPDINAWGARTYHVTPSGIIYILNVHPKYGMHLDKYVPEPVAKKAGGADKAYY